MLTKEAIREFYDRLADRRDAFRRSNRYYYDCLIRYLRFLIPSGQTVLEVGCGDGYLLRRLEPSRGLGCDLSARMVEKARRDAEPGEPIEFTQADVETDRFDRAFDVVLMSDLLGDLLDIQQALLNVRSACSEATRVVITYHSIFWEPLLKLAQRFGLKTPQLHHNWLSPSDVETFATLADFEVIRFERRILLPKWIPLISNLLNRFVALLPVANGLCLLNLVVLRKRPQQPERDLSATILIPCRNERGNIRAAIERLPRFGTHQEVIFVDGHSTDGTPDEIRRVIADFPDKDIKFFVQEGRGKGDAVRLGFSRAAGDVLMILDADLTMPPEDLPKFFSALASGKGEFINGSRLVYPMEHQAMRFLQHPGEQALLGDPVVAAESTAQGHAVRHEGPVEDRLREDRGRSKLLRRVRSLRRLRSPVRGGKTEFQDRRDADSVPRTNLRIDKHQPFPPWSSVGADDPVRSTEVQDRMKSEG